MLLYKDVISGDELFTDTFTVKEVDDIAYEIDTKMVTIKKGADVDIGANPSAEEAQEESEEGTEQVNDLVAAMRLSATSFDKKSYMTYIKGYMKAVKNHLQQTNADRVPVFEKQVQGLVKKILGNFKDYEFYTGEGMDPDGMIALLNYREDGVTPYFTFFKDGLKTEKI